MKENRHLLHYIVSIETKLRLAIQHKLILVVKGLEFIQDGQWSAFLREIVHLRRKVLIVEKNLLETHDNKELFCRKNVTFIEITPELLKAGKYQFAVKSRYLKALYYTKRGWTGHALARGNKIIGDIWHYTHVKSPQVHIHPDLSKFGIKLSKDHVYLFDTFLTPSERGKGLSAALQSSAMHSLSQKGISRAHAYVIADNIPAVWDTKVINKFKVTRTLTISRFIIPKRFVNKS